MLVNFHLNQLHSEEFIYNLFFISRVPSLQEITLFIISAGYFKASLSVWPTHQGTLMCLGLMMLSY